MDAAAVVDVLVGSPVAVAVRRQLVAEPLAAPAHLDAEVLCALARLARDGAVTEDEVTVMLEHLGRMPLQRLPLDGALVEAAWRLRHDIAVRDALYVAAAQGLGARLLTTDARLATAVGDLAIDLE